MIMSQPGSFPMGLCLASMCFICRLYPYFLSMDKVILSMGKVILSMGKVVLSMDKVILSMDKI